MVNLRSFVLLPYRSPSYRFPEQRLTRLEALRGKLARHIFRSSKY